MLPQFTIIFSVLIHLSQQNDCFSPYCSCSSSFITCKGFTSFEQLEFDETNIWSGITLIPEVSLLLNSSLNLSKLKFFENSFISLYNIDGIHVYSSVFQKLQIFNEKDQSKMNGASLRLRFSNSSISFIPFSNANVDELSEYIRCENDEEKNKNFVFSNLSFQEFDFYDSDFPNTILICPLLFNKVNIQEMKFINVKGRLRFRSLNGIQKSIDSKIKSVYLKNNNLNFIGEIDSRTFFNQYIFEKIENIYFDGTFLNSIVDDTLQSFKYLKKLNLENVIQNPSQSNISIFMDTKWIENLNKKSIITLDKLDLSQIADLNYFNQNFFELTINGLPNFLNEDNICLITKFPVNNLVIPYIFNSGGSCSCSTYWLYRYYFKTSKYFNLLPSEVNACFTNLLEENLKVRIENCMIERRCFNISSTIASTIKTIKPTFPPFTWFPKPISCSSKYSIETLKVICIGLGFMYFYNKI